MTVRNSPLLAAWRARSRRERILIGAMVLLLTAVTGWFGLYSPLERIARDAAARRDLASARLAQVEAASQVVSGGPAGETADLAALVAASAAQAGLTLSRQDANSGRTVTVVLEAADPRSFFAWTEALADEGVAVFNFTAVSAGEGTARLEAVLGWAGR